MSTESILAEYLYEKSLKSIYFQVNTKFLKTVDDNKFIIFVNITKDFFNVSKKMSIKIEFEAYIKNEKSCLNYEYHQLGECNDEGEDECYCCNSPTHVLYEYKEVANEKNEEMSETDTMETKNKYLNLLMEKNKENIILELIKVFESIKNLEKFYYFDKYSGILRLIEKKEKKTKMVELKKLISDIEECIVCNENVKDNYKLNCCNTYICVLCLSKIKTCPQCRNPLIKN